MDRNLVCVSALRLDTEERIVIPQGLKRSSPVVERETPSSLTVLETATGAAGVLGEPAASPVEEEENPETDSATNLSMEENPATEKERKPSPATLWTVQFILKL